MTVPVTVLDRAGQAHQVDCLEGISLMENIRAAGLDELLALCGGNLSCGTCHIHVAPQWLAKLPPLSPDEHHLLEISEHRTTASRLSCQLEVGPELAGLTAQIAPEDL